MAEKDKKHKLLLFLTFILLLFAVAFFISEGKIEKYADAQERQESEYLQFIKDQLEPLELKAQSVSIFNIEKNKKIFAKNDSRWLPLASLVKTMTALIALDESPEMVSISKKALEQEGDTSLYLDEVWQKEKLIQLMLVLSSNDAAYALSENDPDFLRKMNQKAHKIGLRKILFLNTTGLDISPQKAGAYGSAEDANMLAVFALKKNPELFKSTKEKQLELYSENGPTHQVKNTNVSLEKMPSSLVFSKTGATDLAGGNLTVIFKNMQGDHIAVTILGSTFKDRFTDMEKITNVLYNTEYEK